MNPYQYTPSRSVLATLGAMMVSIVAVVMLVGFLIWASLPSTRRSHAAARATPATTPATTPTDPPKPTLRVEAEFPCIPYVYNRSAVLVLPTGERVLVMSDPDAVVLLPPLPVEKARAP